MQFKKQIKEMMGGMLKNAPQSTPLPKKIKRPVVPNLNKLKTKYA